MKFNQEYWTNFYRNEKPPWDMQCVSPPLKAYFDQLVNKNLTILIPGAGNAWEAEYLWNEGFKNIFVVDISPIPLQNLKKRVPDFPDNHFLNTDFFELEGQYDLIVEHVFFCSLHPGQRQAYAKKMYDLLTPGGKLVGVLFDFPLNPDNPEPPFGGSLEEYLTYFRPLFKIKTFERCYNSHPARQGRELFMLLIKEKNKAFNK